MTHDHDHKHCHDEHHHNSHDHSHDHGHGVELDDTEKLKIRIQHWIGHNMQHRDSLDEWSDRARESGLEKVADALDRSSQKLSDSVDELETALTLFD